MTDLFDVMIDDPMLETAALAKSQGLYPYFLPLERSEGTEAVLDGRRLVMAGANNYLGLATDIRVLRAAVSAIARYGTSCTGSRFMNGTLAMHLELEDRMARFIGMEKALVFATGYQANLGAITALMNEDHVAVCDKEIHASIIDSVRMAGAQLARFRHNDPDDLDRVLAEHDGIPAMVLVDGVYSMGGDIARLPEIIDVARTHGARVFVDDAHGLGVIGPGGRGTAAHFGCVRDVDVVMGTFSKSFASVGGVIAGSAEVIEFIRHNARPLLFSAALPPPSAAATLAALDVLESEPDRPSRAHRHADRVRHELRAMGYDCGASETPIIPVRVGEEFETIATWKALVDRGVYTNPVVSPAVPPRQGMLRTSYMATHTDAHIDHVLTAFSELRRDRGRRPPNSP
ncbi:aminotransferase class I/II-fold pyridoxal phosphate-dependent enzyme [Actinokineospora sp.]|uniref:aminotransferase class I/II-fold pyridoxal phosphate-dependent enzyme n=1 Tax=Actinokineospora sp. TaxID=1872133 RepID=UPI004037C62B